MLLSIVIPCYNKADYLLELLCCCQNQSLYDWEVILVDDGSNEDEYNKIYEFSKGDDRIRLIKRSRLPKNGDTCRNIGLSEVKGKYTLILDSDDIIADTCFENRVKYMENHPDIDYATFPGKPFIGTIDSTENTFLKTRYGIKSNNNSIPYNLLNLEYPFTVWTNIYRTNKIQEILWDEKIYVMQDLDWMLSCHFANLKHSYSESKEYDYFYRQFESGNNVCSDFSSPLKCNSTIYLCDKIKREVCNYKVEDLNAVYRKFVVRQFQRIIQGKNRETTFLFLDKCSFLDSKTVCKMRKVANRFLSKETKVDPLRLYALLCFYVSPKYYWRELAHCILAIIKGVNPRYFT